MPFMVSCWAHFCVVLISKTCCCPCCWRAWAMFNFIVAFWMWRVLGSDGACLSRLYSKVVHVCSVNACVCPDCLCCVASRACLSPLVFAVSRREVLAAVVTFFVR